MCSLVFYSLFHALGSLGLWPYGPLETPVAEGTLLCAHVDNGVWDAHNGLMDSNYLGC